MIQTSHPATTSMAEITFVVAFHVPLDAKLTRISD